MDTRIILFCLACLLLALLAILPLIDRLRRRRKPPEAAAADLDLFGKKRPVLTVKLPDGTLLRLTTPCKSVSDRFEDIGTLLDRIAQGHAAPEDIDSLYALMAVVLARNLDHIVISQKHLEETMSADDCVEFFAAYMDFLTKEISSKN